MSRSGNILPITNLSAGSGPLGNHPKFGAPVRATAANPATYDMPPDRVPILSNHFSSNDSSLSSNVSSGSQLSTSTTTSANIVFHHPMPLPMSSYPSDARAVDQPQGRSARALPHLPTPEPQTQPLPPAQAHPPTEPHQPLSSDGQASAAEQPHSARTFTYSSEQTSYLTPSPGIQSSYAHRPHPQSIFGDGDDIPDSSGSRREAMSPPPDYWSSARQDAR